MILNLSIENYRSFKEEVTFTMVAESSKSKDQNIFVQSLSNGEYEDEVKLLNSAVIYGANASGKTNLLRCLFEIINFIGKSTQKAGEPISIYAPFLFDESTINKPTQFKIEFIGKDNLKYKYELAFNQKQIVNETLHFFPLGKQKLLFERIDDKEQGSRIHKAKLGADIKKKEIEVFNNQTILSKFGTDIPDSIVTEIFIYINNIEVINACNSRRVSSLQNEVSKLLLNDNELKRKMDELIAFADTGIKSLSISENEENELKFPDDIPEEVKSAILNDYKYKIFGIHDLYLNEKISGKQNLKFEDESHGTKTIFSLGGKLLQSLSLGSIIFIDEIETGLHPYLSKLLVSLFQNKRINSKNAQLIFTTHDTNLLDRRMFRKDQVWFAEKNEKGITELFSLQDFSDVREDTPFDKWYLAGKFGGVPNIKSLESLFAEE